MSEDIKLFVSCHKPGVHMPENDLLQPIHVGAGISSVTLPGMLRDDTGDNMSGSNRSYCELTGQYWAWKNVEADYYGFLHYRRYLNFSGVEMPIHHEPFIFGDVVFDRNDDETLSRIGFDEATMRPIIEAHDFIAPTPIATPDGVNVYEQYRLSCGHHIEDLDLVLDIIEHEYPDIWPSAKRYLEQDKLYVCNMFVMRREIFRDYSAFLFDVLGRHAKLADTSHYTPVARRVEGYLGERICGMYLTYLYDKGLDGIDLQRVYFRDVTEPGFSAAAPAHREAGLTFGPVTRGMGKVFCSIEGAGGVRLTATSVLADGTEVPAKVVPTKGGPVLVLSVMSSDQTATVRMGDDVATTSRRFPATLTKLESQKNTFLRNHEANVVRNCDRNPPSAADVRVRPGRIISDVDGTDIIQGTVTIPLADGQAADELVEVFANGPDGRRASGGDWICLSDEVIASGDQPQPRLRRVSFSLRVPRLPSYMIWARFPDGGRQDGFSAIEPHITRTMRHDWAAIVEPAAKSDRYDYWFRDVHRVFPGELEVERSTHFGTEPTFSIIVPLFRTPIDFLRDMADSVLAQSYANWELVLVDASPEDAELSAVVDEYCRRYARIKRVDVAENRGITENTNEGIKAAAGDFLCFLDHDDVIEPDALYCYVRAINERPDTDMLYCDEDKLKDGRYVEPFLKPDWNPDLLLGMNYVCHFLTVRKSIVDGLELPGREYDGSQDWHMTFRVGERARHVYHVPRVLYHWRIHENSTAASAAQKDYTLDSSLLSVRTHLERSGIKGTVRESPLSPRRFVVDYDLADRPLVSIVIPNKDNVRMLARCLTSVLRHSTYSNYEVVIVENNSTDPETFAYYEQVCRAHGNVRVVTLEGMEGFNFSRIVNFGVAASKGDYVLMLNNDVEVLTPGWIEQMLGNCMREDVGVVGAKLLFPDHTTQHAGVTFGTEGPCHLYYLLPERVGGNFEATLLARDMVAVTGACLMISREEYDAVGGMEEGLAVNYNDVDLCLKVVERGHHVVYCPTAQLLHYESVSRGSETSGDKARRFRTEKGEFMRRWPAYFEDGDPFGNPNFIPGNAYCALNATVLRGDWQ
ncbi:MAG: DUF4422 domain-containing protein [Atopobiaceae bacterium]|nr:DUF4422 domain-containing protein [Atopobiaceae bacterium]MCI2173858.1 DUF4422 domain-containing protein [Atopobiaceae bacterium]MCI2208052.1 DUF4422 domain-containing protein [Atopobiaceae bacterium]